MHMGMHRIHNGIYEAWPIAYTWCRYIAIREVRVCCHVWCVRTRYGIGARWSCMDRYGPSVNAAIGYAAVNDPVSVELYL